MKFTQYNSGNRVSKNLFRERSITSLPSRQISVMSIINGRESVILTDRKKFQQQKSLINSKQFEISKLRKNLQSAVSTALNEKLQNSKSKEELMEYHHMKTYLQNKIKLYEKQLNNARQKNQSYVENIAELNNRLRKVEQKARDQQERCEKKGKELQKMIGVSQQLQRCRIQMKDIGYLKERIIVLQQNVREQKITKQNIQAKNKDLNKEIERLNKAIVNFKPQEQDMRERIAYFQRVNLDLQRKMEDYNRRENDYIKNITLLKMNLTKVTAERNYGKTVLQETGEKLQKKTLDFIQLQQRYDTKVKIIQDLQKDISIQRQNNENLKNQIQGSNAFYKKQGEENRILNKKYKLLKDHEEQLIRVIKSHMRIAEEVNLQLIKNIEELKKARIVYNTIKQSLAQAEEKFQKFDLLLKDGSEKSYNQVREGYYTIIRTNNDLSVAVKQLKHNIQQQSLLHGEQRDTLTRQLELNKEQLPTDQSQFIPIFNEKSQSILLLEKSNDQLINVKKDLQNKVEQLNGQIQKLKKQLMILKMKAADLFKTRKELQQARKNAQRYQEMIEEERQVIQDLKSQLTVLRQRNNELTDKNFMIDLERKNLIVKIKETQDIMKQLNIQSLMAYKTQNDKNAHLITDSVQKLQSAIKSLSFFFNCAFCGELPITPVTLAFCGHNYCTKCKEAYQESCYECDTGQPIEKAFQNKLLKDASGKYKFLTMVFSELDANFVKKK